VLLRYLNRRRKTGLAQDHVDHSSIEDPWNHEKLLAATQVIDWEMYQNPTVMVARKLLGCVLFHKTTAGMIVEVEAYLGLTDLAAHASKGMTERTRVIFGPGGHAYVYFIYGMHECLNVVAEPEGSPGCVLIRALEPLTGLTEMYARRHWQGAIHGLANGPGKLTEALAITRAQYGLPLDRGALQIRRWNVPLKFEIEETPRIGIRKNADWPLRFVWKGHSCLSRR
jgi:DNA-3-methyladenine glycosylase